MSRPVRILRDTREIDASPKGQYFDVIEANEKDIEIRIDGKPTKLSIQANSLHAGDRVVVQHGAAYIIPKSMVEDNGTS